MFPHPLFRIGIGALLLSGAPALAEPPTVVIGGSGKPAVTVDMGVLETLDRPTMRRYLLMPGSGPANDGRVELRRPGSLAAGSGTTPPASEPAESESATLSPPAEPVMAPVETAVPPPPARPVVEIPLTPPPLTPPPLTPPLLAQPKIAPPKEVVLAPAPAPAPVPVKPVVETPLTPPPLAQPPLTQPKITPPKEVVLAPAPAPAPVPAPAPAPAPVPVKPVVETPLAQPKVAPPPLTQPKVTPPKEVVLAPAPAPVPVKPVVETPLAPPPLAQPKVAPPKEVVSAPVPAPAPAPAPVPVKPVVETTLAPPPPVKLTEPKSFPLPEAKPQTSAAAVPAKRPERAEEVASLSPPASAFKAGEPLRLAFGSESALLSDTAKIALESFARQLKEKPSLRIQLLAYASGTQETALQARRLSLSRALVVRSHLIEQGISSIRMDVRALGNKVEGEPSDRVDLVIANDE